MVKYRPEVRGAAAGELEIFHIGPQVFQVVNHVVGPNLVVALNDADIHLPGEGPRAA